MADRDCILQVFADDRSASIRGEDEKEVIRRAHMLAAPLRRALEESGLTLSPSTCENFLISLLREGLNPFERGNFTRKWMRTEVKIRNMALDRQNRVGGERVGNINEVLPFPAVGSFRLLGLQLDHRWTFQGHLREIRRKPRVTMAIIGEVSNTIWGF